MGGVLCAVVSFFLSYLLTDFFIHPFLALIGCLWNAWWPQGPFACREHGRCFRETSVSATVLHPPRREVHAGARHGPHLFGGLRSFIHNLRMVESGTADTVDFQKSQDSTFASLEMVCLYFKDVN